MTISSNYIYVVLKKASYVLRKPRPRHYRQDPRQVHAFKKMTAELKNRPRSRVLALDECTIALQAHPRKIVARKGSKPVMPIDDNRKGISVIAGITGTGRLLVTT